MKFKIKNIPADASHRNFYRLIFKKKSRILISAKKDKYKNLIAYTAINKFLRSKKILAPKLFEYNFLKGEIVIEDFGNITFHKILVNQKNKFKTYKKIIDLLIKIQKIKPKYKIKNVNNKFHTIDKYSYKHLNNESNLFFKWYLPMIFNKKKTLHIKKKVKKILSQKYKKIYFSNSHFIHRDFHVQNLMKIKNKIGVLDTQDALIGNAAYDLVSLIDDVRIKTSKKLKNKVYKYYLNKTFKIYKNNSPKFLQDFQILSVQRSLKIIGIFSRLFKRDKKNQYLKLIPYAWKLLEMRLDSKIFTDLKKILDHEINQKIRRKILFK